MSILIKEITCSRLHFVGVFGVGMSAIAQYLSPDLTVSGSDREIDHPARKKTAQCLTTAGIILHPQDGSGVTGETSAVVVSTAIDSDNPDVLAARRLGIAVLHRSEVLATLVNRNRTIAVTGTSGKSSVSAQIFHILHTSGLSPSYIGGANLNSLTQQGLLGNSFRGDSDILVIEADESDGTVVRYHAETMVILNVSRDHREESDVLSMMKTAAKQARYVVANGDDVRLNPLGNIHFGTRDRMDFTAEGGEFSAGRYQFFINGRRLSTDVPGTYVRANCAAAAAAVSTLGIDLQSALSALETYPGIERRFDIIGTDCVTVIDDYAHNPDKLKSAMEAARYFDSPLTVVFQPHGFGPLRFLFEDFHRLFADSLRGDDMLILLPVYYAGGRVDRSVDSGDLCRELADSITVWAPSSKEAARDLIQQRVHTGTVLVAGARDTELTDFAKQIYSSIRGDHDNGKRLS
ncbi:MAG: glutamate ligase domain-containing protein [Fibrobacterota bacterium]